MACILFFVFPIDNLMQPMAWTFESSEVSIFKGLFVKVGELNGMMLEAAGLSICISEEQVGFKITEEIIWIDLKTN